MRERCVGVGVRRGGVGDSRNGNEEWVRIGKESGSFAQGLLPNTIFAKPSDEVIWTCFATVRLFAQKRINV